jgi:hypothetical protein
MRNKNVLVYARSFSNTPILTWGICRISSFFFFYFCCTVIQRNVSIYHFFSIFSFRRFFSVLIFFSLFFALMCVYNEVTILEEKHIPELDRSWTIWAYVILSSIVEHPSSIDQMYVFNRRNNRLLTLYRWLIHFEKRE